MVFKRECLEFYNLEIRQFL